MESKDGILYRISPISPPKTKHPFSTPDDETEPGIILIYRRFVPRIVGIRRV
ncbi:hypothetical protein [Candidatus Nitrosocosmicus sp. FF01]|uniref:hypothetical protein n=1 Tax=Candidatus Nitrosocosmicus sp. FF01 TaxID=3397670 RepID=UPI0039E777B8